MTEVGGGHFVRVVGITVCWPQILTTGDFCVVCEIPNVSGSGFLCNVLLFVRDSSHALLW